MSKVAETIPATSKDAKSNTAFFNKARGNFLSSTAETETPFFSCQSSSATIQAKLNIGQPNDKYEQEADAMADKVMRMPVNKQPFFSPQPLSISRLQRKCQHCEEEEKMQRKENNSAAMVADVATESYTSSLNGKGKSLTHQERSFFEPRFGYNFSDVQLHTNNDANESAKSMNALAYTHRKNIVFGSGQYQSDTDNGKNLLAHELTHVVQQNQAPGSALQRACRSPAQCAVPIAGNAGTFGATVEAESEALAVASGGTAPVGGGPSSCLRPRHRQRATNFEALATGAGSGVAIAPGIGGFFINACLSPNDGANNAPCSDFPGGAPPGTAPGQACVQLHTTDEDMAIALLAKPRPFAGADLTNFLWITATVKHESQHNIFDANPSAVASFVPPAGDCNLSTVVPIAANHDVESLLSEISAEIAEFDVYFRNSVANPGRPGNFAMQTEEHNIATRGGENILGNIKALQCACNCSTVDTFVVQVFNQASSSWSPAEKIEFKRAMTAFMPSFWPRSLHQS